MPKYARALGSGLAATAVVLASLLSFDLTASAQPGRSFTNSDFRGDSCDTQKLDGPDKGSTSTGGTSDIVLVDGGREMFEINTDLGGEVEGLISIARRQ